jgi:hypothetical protein
MLLWNLNCKCSIERNKKELKRMKGLKVAFSGFSMKQKGIVQWYTKLIESKEKVKMLTVTT